MKKSRSITLLLIVFILILIFVLYITTTFSKGTQNLENGVKLIENDNYINQGTSEKMSFVKSGFFVNNFSGYNLLIHAFEGGSMPIEHSYKESDICSYELCDLINNQCEEKKTHCQNTNCNYEKCVRSGRQAYINDYLIIDYENKEIGIHINEFMPSGCQDLDERNYEQEQRKAEGLISYEKIFPDMKTLEINNKKILNVPNSNYFSRNNSIFKPSNCNIIYYQPIIEADFDSFFVGTGWNTASDKNHSYYFWGTDTNWRDLSYSANYNNNVITKDGVVMYPFYKIIE